MTEVVTRQASSEDALGIARVHIQAWRETYTRLVEPGELDALDVEARAERWALIMDGGVTVWVAEVDDVVVGFASASPRSEPSSPRPLVLEAIYVIAEHHGSGAGQELLDAVIGDSPAFLMVAADNPRALAFYRRNGFELDGVIERHTLVRTQIDAARMVR